MAPSPNSPISYAETKEQKRLNASHSSCSFGRLWLG
jgi:hypothetical protein